MRFPFTAKRLAVAVIAFLVLTLFGQGPAPAAAATEAQALAAAQRGAQWIAAQQESNGSLGSFGGDWSMTALAAAGVNAADVRTSLLEPSAQDFYLAAWTSEGPGGAATDDERAILSGYAGGLQTSRLDARTNLLADLASQFDGHELGGHGATNADIFGLLALDVSGTPSAVMGTLARSVSEQQGPDGGWNFAAGAATSDVDMTGAAIAALCAAGATPADPALVHALTYLHAAQDPATGGFVSATLGLNTDTTGWVSSGLRRCGIDPQSWVTARGKTPLDFLLAQQNPDGSFQWRAGDQNEDLYATQDAVRPLAGAAFTAPAPARLHSDQPPVRPAPTVAAGTPVPMTLVIDSASHVTGGSSIRMCDVTAPQGATVAQMLQNANYASSPAYCVSDLALNGGRIARLNGVAGKPGQLNWEVRREGGPAEADTNGSVGLGALVQVRLVSNSHTRAPEPPLAAPTPEPPPVSPVGASKTGLTATATPAGAAAPVEQRTPVRLGLRLGALSHVRHGVLNINISCPRGTGAEGCQSFIRVRVALRTGRGGPIRPQLVGEREVHLAAGSSTVVRIALSRSIRQALRARPDRLAWVLAAMRDPRSGALTTASASTVLR